MRSACPSARSTTFHPVILLLFILFPLCLPFAALLARACSFRPPKDFTTGPWCAGCRYSLQAIPESAPCPECGGLVRLSTPSGYPNAKRWILFAGVLSLISHIPVFIAWILAKQLESQSIAISCGVMLLEALLAGGTIAILAARIRGPLLTTAIVLLTVPQFLADAGLSILTALEPSDDYKWLAYATIPLLGMIIAPPLFILFVIGATIRKNAQQR